MILRVPPENLWPTGATPPELRESLHANGQMTHEEVRASQGVANYVPPPRPRPNIAELEAERQSLRIVESVSPEPPAIVVPRGAANVQRYLVPLSATVNAEIIIHGSAKPSDYKLLQRYVKLMGSIEPIVAEMSSPVIEPSIKRPRKSYASA